MDEIEQLAMLFKALSDPTRLRLLKCLNGNAMPDECSPTTCDGAEFLCVNALACHLDVTQSAVSQHLRILKQAGLVNGVRRGNFMHYSLDREGLERYGDLLQDIFGMSFAGEV